MDVLAELVLSGTRAGNAEHPGFDLLAVSRLRCSTFTRAKPCTE